MQLHFISKTVCINWERQCAERELLDAVRRAVYSIPKCNVIEMTVRFHTVNGVTKIKIKHVFE